VGQALPNLQAFFNAKADDTQVAQTWECFAGAIQLFEKYVRSSDSTSNFSAVEFRAFLEKYFMGTLQISDQLMYQVMRLKQVLIGGAIDEITRDDLKQIENLLSGIEREALALNRHMKVITNVSNASQMHFNEVDVNFAESQLIASAKNLGLLFNGSKVPYNFSDFKSLMTEFSAFFDQLGTHWAGPQYVIDHLDELAIFKVFFLRPEADSIAPHEWDELFSTAAQIYGASLRINYILANQDRLTTGYGLDQLVICVNKFFDALKNAIDRKPNKRIEFDQVKSLLSVIFDLGIIDYPKIKKNTTLNLVAPVFFKIYSPAKAGVRPVPLGVDERIFEMMRDDFLSWAEMQKIYDQIISKLPVPQNSPSLVQLRGLWESQSQTAKYETAADEIKRILQRDRPQQFRSNGSLIFESDILNLPLDQEAFTGINWRRIFISSLLRGYTEDADQYHFDGVTRDELHQFYTDIRQFGIDLKFLDPRVDMIWSSLFLYSHLFLLSSEKSDRVNFQQGMDIVSYSMSSAIMSRRAYSDLRSRCQNFENDVFGLPMLDVDCYRMYFRKQFAVYFQELPHWVKAANSWSDLQWQTFQTSIENLARVHGNSSAHLESADLDKTSMIFQYIDTLYVRNDNDGSDTLNVKESMNFYPLLHDALIDASGISNESLIESVFTYIMKFGVAPTKDLYGLYKLFLWKLQKSSWAYEDDRIQMVKVLTTLSDAEPQAQSLIQNSLDYKPNSKTSVNPVISTLSITAPNVEGYVWDVFAEFTHVHDWRELFKDPAQQQDIQNFYNQINH